MLNQILTLGKRYWTDFRGFSAGQKAATVAAVLGLIIGAIVYSSWSSPPNYAPLYTNLAASDASAIVDKLNSTGVKYQLANAGTEILVPQSQVYSTRLAMSSAGLPNSSQSGYSLLDKESITTSDFKQHVDYQRAIEGELDNTIESITGIQAASVHLAIPTQDVFNDGTQKPTAAVLLTTTSGTQLTTQQVQSIVYLVSSAVPGMSTDGVTVTDQKGDVLAAAGTGITDVAATGTQTQATNSYDTTLSAQLQAMVDQVVGAGHGVVTVNATLNFDKVNTTTNSYTYNKNTPPVSSQTTNKSYTGANAANGGTLGSTTTTSTGSTTSTAGGTMKETDSTVNNALGTEQQTTTNAPGNVKKLSIGVLLDSSVTGVNLTAIQNLIKSTAGIDPTRGDQLSVTAMPFDTSAAKAAAAADAAAAKATAAKASAAQMQSLIKQGVLGALILGIFLATWLGSRRRRKQGDSFEPDDELLFDEPAPAYVPAAPAPEHLAVVSDINEAVARRRALVALADEQPQDVASVLSGWLKSKES